MLEPFCGSIGGCLGLQFCLGDVSAYGLLYSGLCAFSDIFAPAYRIYQVAWGAARVVRFLNPAMISRLFRELIGYTLFLR